MIIDIFIDFVCPFCYIGKTELLNAIKNLDEDVKINYRAFELNSHAKKEPGKSYMDHIYERFPSKDFADQKIIKPLKKRAEALGLSIDFYDLDESNTLDAHRILKYAEKKGKDGEFLDHAFKKVFEDNIFIASHNELLKISEDVGLDKKEIEEILSSKAYEKEVREDEKLAKDMAVAGVPFFIFDGKYSLSGAQTEDVFKEVIEKVISERNPINLEKDSSMCGFNGCQ